MAFEGTCNDMCPQEERATRVGFNVSIFERDQSNQPNEFLMVKEYRRAGADQKEPLPSDLRTLRALDRTMNHLVSNIMDDLRSKSPELALEWYDFLWDRLRAIRKDMTQQNFCDQQSAKLVEICTRFHIHTCYAMNRVKDFDVDMNKRSLNDCLQMLRQIYIDLKVYGINCPGELEFQKYDILLHFDDDCLHTNVLMKTSDFRSTDEMKFIIQLFDAYSTNNYYRFFKLYEEADYMTSCILSLYVNKMRMATMKIMAAGCQSRQTVWYPAELAIIMLGLDDLNDLKLFANFLDISVQEKNSKYFLLFDKNVGDLLRRPRSLPPLKSRRLVDNKMRNFSVGQLVCNCDTYQLDTSESPELLESPMLIESPGEELDVEFEENENVNEVQMTVHTVETRTRHPMPLSPSLNFGRKVTPPKQPQKPAPFAPAAQYSRTYNRSTYDSAATRQVQPPRLVEKKISPSTKHIVQWSKPDGQASTPRTEEPKHESHQNDTEVITISDTDSDDDQQRYEEASRIMPAGRFRRSSRPVQSSSNPPPTNVTTKPSRTPKNKSSVQEESIKSIIESINYEKAANKNLLDLVRMFV